MPAATTIFALQETSRLFWDKFLKTHDSLKYLLSGKQTREAQP